MNRSQIKTAIAALAGARSSTTPIDSLPEDARPADIAAGYAIQDAFAAQMEAAGDTVVGWKIACTSAEAQAMFKVDKPFSGRIHRSVHFQSPINLFAGDFHAMGMEGEFAFTMGETLPPNPKPYTQDEVAAAIATLHPAIEGVGARYREWLGVGAPSTVADNAANAFLVTGPGRADWRDLDLEASAVEMTIDGRTVQAGTGALALGGPLKAMTWFANHLSSRELPLEAGAVVTTGTCTGAQFAQPGNTVVARFADLEEVRIEVRL